MCSIVAVTVGIDLVDTLPPCRKCGCKRYYVNGIARGTAKAYFNEEGEYVEMWTERAWFDLSFVVRCEDCSTINPLLSLDKSNRLIVTKK